VEGAFRVEYTPGHASHHVCYLHEASGMAFVGDMAGVRVPSGPFTLAPTPPPDIDVEAWERSLATIAGWHPQRLGLTHFGEVDDPGAQLDRVRERLHEQAGLAAEHDLDGFVAAYSARAHEEAGEAADSILQAAPLDQLYLGLDRYLTKSGRVT
jgi:glyoxylase-like metal-dependent hydrolase (beta-lactamase superfamily II)